MTTKYVILGLLAQGPMSGYDIKGVFKNLDWMIDSPSYGTLYPTLHALLEEGFVSMDVEPGQGTPSRKIYTLTPDGHKILRAWLTDAALPESSIRAFARQLILADSLSPDELREHLKRRRAQVSRYVQADDDGSPEDQGDEGKQEPAVTLGKRLVNDYGLAIAQAELAWLDVQLEALR
jgi:PadR family transcriptional regulator, regulatory protein AphA